MVTFTELHPSIPSHAEHPNISIMLDGPDKGGLLAPSFEDPSFVIQETFEKFASNGIPMVIKNVILQGGWTPTRFIERFGNHRVRVINCQNEDTEKTVTVAKFFENFNSPVQNPEEIWKLKVNICLAR